jgi:hypothetical protein
MGIAASMTEPGGRALLQGAQDLASHAGAGLPGL